MSENQESPTNEVNSKSGLSTMKKIGIGFGVFILISFIAGLLGGTSSESTSSDNTSVASSEETTVDAAPWYPDGYSEVQDGIAFKWMTVAEDNASDACTGDHCWGAYVIVRDGCSDSLYAEITISDRQDVQIGYTNDSVGSVAPGTKVRLMFNSYEASASTANLSKISCY